MKKLSLLLGTLGGATAGYLFSNKKLREQLAKAKNPEEAAKLFGAHLQKDGKKLAKHVQDFCHSEEVRRNASKAKKFAEKKMDQAKKELEELARKGAAGAKKKMKSTVSKARGVAKKAAKKGVSKATSTARKMKTKVRKLS